LISDARAEWLPDNPLHIPDYHIYFTIASILKVIVQMKDFECFAPVGNRVEILLEVSANALTEDNVTNRKDIYF
jgi:hypothetical protein